ncbi:MAG: hypothetical protein ACI8UO_000148 [Verrucomicrobiales bacterium]|jgi:hypothetical protein
MPEENPYAPPATSSSATQKGLGRDGKLGLIGNIICGGVGPVVAVVGMVLSMIRAFSNFSEGGSTAAQLAADISTGLYSVAAGMLLSAIGMVIILVVFFRRRNRRKWFYILSICTAVVISLTFRWIGMIGGFIILIPFLLETSEFFPNKRKSS